ncbi:related to PHO86-Targeting and packing of Pho84p inorganic phospate transporter [Zygosaccharomyces bailii ISA1307]|nr:related to PHO86-Targeting and packing of Pho84p inorganic phospate transporter [Zygosaccharomyces bailii ISA1307]
MSKEVRNRKVARQVDARLHEPLDSETPGTIQSSELKPEYANAALNMAADFVKQKESLANMAILGHPLVVAIVWVVAIYFAAPKAKMPFQGDFGNYVSFLWQLFKQNKTVLPTVIIAGCLGTMVIFTLMSRVTESFFNSLTKEIVNSKGKNVFGVDLNKLAEGKCSQEELEHAKDTYIVIYRGTPVALVCLVQNKILSTKDDLVMSVSTMGSRKVYEKSGIIEDLVDWCMVRTKQKYVKGNYTGKMQLLVDLYSFDPDNKKVLRQKGFTMLKSQKIQGSFILGKIFGLEKELWGSQFHYEKPSKRS